MTGTRMFRARLARKTFLILAFRRSVAGTADAGRFAERAGLLTDNILEHRRVDEHNLGAVDLEIRREGLLRIRCPKMFDVVERVAQSTFVVVDVGRHGDELCAMIGSHQRENEAVRDQCSLRDIPRLLVHGNRHHHIGQNHVEGIFELLEEGLRFIKR